MNRSDIALLVQAEGVSDFGHYTRALLQLEGLDAEIVSLDQFASTQWPGRVIIASDLPLMRDEAIALRDHAMAGNRLICFAPPPHVAEIFGFAPTYRMTVDGIMRLRLPHFTDEPMQFHAALRHLKVPAQAAVLAEVCAPESPYMPNGDAAIVRLPFGAGEAIFFLYDLPRSIALTRQGDPRRSGLHGNHVWPGWRAADMFADFQNLDCAHLPQADLQCHLLRHLLTQPLAHERIGLPFVWYFPNDAPSALLLSSDEDWSTSEQFQALHDCVRRHDAQITYYLVSDTCITPAQMAQWEAEGDSFSIHPYHKEPLLRTWRDTVRHHRAAFEARFGKAPSASVRNHIIAWVGYTQAAHWDHALGFRWDSNYFTCPPKTRHYMTGSGLPMPIVDEDGRVTTIWQQPCQFSDETTLAAGGFEFSLKFSESEGIACISDLLRANAVAHHSLLCINTHPVSFATYSGGLWDAVIAAAKRLGIPCWSLDRFAQFWELRQQLCIGAATQTPHGYAWSVQVPADAQALSLLMVAPEHTVFTWNDEPATTMQRVVHGIAYTSIRLPETTGLSQLRAVLSC